LHKFGCLEVCEEAQVKLYEKGGGINGRPKCIKKGGRKHKAGFSKKDFKHTRVRYFMLENLLNRNANRRNSK